MSDVAQIIADIEAWMPKANGVSVPLNRYQIHALLDEVKRLREACDGWDKYAMEMQDLAASAEAELARLREPAGDVGEVLNLLRPLHDDMPALSHWHPSTVKVRTKQAAELLTRQAAEIERLTKELGRTAEEKHALSLQLHNQSGVMARATTIEARLGKAVEALRVFRDFPNSMKSAIVASFKDRARTVLSELEQSE